VIPDWPARELYRGRLLHAADYCNAESFRGADVLVVGPGCSGMEIAYDLVKGGAIRVRLAVRTPPRIEIVAGVEELEENGVRLVGGTHIEPDAIIAATGYRRALEDMVGQLDVLDERGVPRVATALRAATSL